MVTIMQVGTDIRFNLDRLKELASHDRKTWGHMYQLACNRQLAQLVRSVGEVRFAHREAVLQAINSLRRLHPTVYGIAVDSIGEPIPSI